MFASFFNAKIHQIQNVYKICLKKSTPHLLYLWQSSDKIKILYDPDVGCVNVDDALFEQGVSFWTSSDFDRSFKFLLAYYQAIMKINKTSSHSKGWIISIYFSVFYNYLIKDLTEDFNNYKKNVDISCQNLMNKDRKKN